MSRPRPARLFSLAGDPALRYLLSASAVGVAIFGLLRLGWVERSLLLPFTHFQQRVACVVAGDPTGPIVVGLSCSAADVIALCLGAILAFPVPWRRRVAGAAGGLVMIVGLNIARLGSLGRVAERRDLFQLLHLYLWPGALVLAVAVYVFLWMRLTRAGVSEPVRRLLGTWAEAPGRPARRFLILAPLLVAGYLWASPWLFETSFLVRSADAVSATAAALVRSLGGFAERSGDLFRTAHGVFRVTPECVLTPVLPLYLAAVAAVPLGWRRRGLALAAALPLFFTLATARLLVLVLPLAFVRSHLFAVHGFHQVLLGLAVVGLVAAWGSRGERGWLGRGVLAVGAGLGLAAAAGPAYTSLIYRLVGSSPPDPQGALLILPAFQTALLAALWLAGRGGFDARVVAAFGLLIASQPLTLLLIDWLWSRWSLPIHPLLVRSWAVAAPVGVFALFRRPGSAIGGESRYLRFWEEVGRSFPDLAGARSTLHYRRDEEWLLRRLLPLSPGLTLLKTDLWDEAKNTRILHWASAEGACSTGVDISPPIVEIATRGQPPGAGARIRGVVADVRRLPFRTGAFDAVYSMGTVEHFDDTRGAVAEIARVLRPGGRAVVGVPNRHDPFLRPLLVWALFRLGLYGYGFEKSYSRRSFRRLLEGAGLEVRAEEGILFLPGWLRMLDLLCWTRARWLARLTAPAVALFDHASRRWPRLRRHGYLLASLGVRPAAQGDGSTDSVPRA